MLCALLKNGIVVEIADITEESNINYSLYSNVIEIENLNPQPKIGWSFDGRELIPPHGEVTQTSMTITKLAYRQRFTTQELVAIYVAKESNPVLNVLLDNLSTATFIDLSRSDTYSGTMYLVQQNLLTLARAQEILTKLPTKEEIYKG